MSRSRPRARVERTDREMQVPSVPLPAEVVPRGVMPWVCAREQPAYRPARQFAESSGGQLNIAKRVLHGHLYDLGPYPATDRRGP